MTIAQTINGRLRRIPAWPIWLLGLLPFWFIYQGMTGQLGPEPIRALEQVLGRSSLRIIVAIMAVTPLRMATGISLIKYRRALGLLFVYYVAVHLLVWLVLDVQDFGRIWADIVKRPYITIGMAAFILMIPLAFTSNNLAVRKMGAMAWKQLHWLTYLIAILGAVHFVMIRKGWQVEPLIYLAIFAVLLLMRIKRKRARVAAKTTS